MIRRAGLQRRPAGSAGSDRETNPGMGDRVRLAVRLRPDAPLSRRPPNGGVRQSPELVTSCLHCVADRRFVFSRLSLNFCGFCGLCVDRRSCFRVFVTIPEFLRVWTCPGFVDRLALSVLRVSHDDDWAISC